MQCSFSYMTNQLISNSRILLKPNHKHNKTKRVTSVITALVKTDEHVISLQLFFCKFQQKCETVENHSKQRDFNELFLQIDFFFFTFLIPKQDHFKPLTIYLPTAERKSFNYDYYWHKHLKLNLTEHHRLRKSTVLTCLYCPLAKLLEEFQHTGWLLSAQPSRHNACLQSDAAPRARNALYCLQGQALQEPTAEHPTKTET